MFLRILTAHANSHATLCIDARLVKKLGYLKDSNVAAHSVDSRELKKPRRRRQGQRRLKNEFIFYLRISRYSKVIYFVYTDKTFLKLNLGHSGKLEIKILEISRRGSRSPDNEEFGHFTLFFCRGR